MILKITNKRFPLLMTQEFICSANIFEYMMVRNAKKEAEKTYDKFNIDKIDKKTKKIIKADKTPKILITNNQYYCWGDSSKNGNEHIEYSITDLDHRFNTKLSSFLEDNNIDFLNEKNVSNQAKLINTTFINGYVDFYNWGKNKNEINNFIKDINGFVKKTKITKPSGGLSFGFRLAIRKKIKIKNKDGSFKNKNPNSYDPFHLTIDYQKKYQVNNIDFSNGCIAIDCNTRNIALTFLDMNGDIFVPKGYKPYFLIEDNHIHKNFNLEQLEGEAKENCRRMMIKKIVKIAKKLNMPICAELLADGDRNKKKKSKKNGQYAKILSRFDARMFQRQLERQTIKEGVALKINNSHYTSIIGVNKFWKLLKEIYLYPITKTKQEKIKINKLEAIAAAKTIGRRGMGIKENVAFYPYNEKIINTIADEMLEIFFINANEWTKKKFTWEKSKIYNKWRILYRLKWINENPNANKYSKNPWFMEILKEYITKAILTTRTTIILNILLIQTILHYG